MKVFRNLKKILGEHAKSNSLEFFGKKKKRLDDFLDASRNPILKPSKNKETGDEDDRYKCMKVKLPVDKKEDGKKFNFTVFMENKEKMDITPETVKNIKSRGFVKCAITPNVYVINGKLGCSWYLHQAQYWEPEGDNGYVDKEQFCLLSSDDEDEDEDNSKDENQIVDSDSD